MNDGASESGTWTLAIPIPNTSHHDPTPLTPLGTPTPLPTPTCTLIPTSILIPTPLHSYAHSHSYSHSLPFILTSIPTPSLYYPHSPCLRLVLASCLRDSGGFL